MGGCDRRDALDLRDDPVEARAIRRAGETAVGSGAGQALRSLTPEHGVDDVAGHDPIRRVLAARDPDDAVALDRDAMLAGCLHGRATTRRDERPQPGVRADHVTTLQADIERVIDGPQQLIDLPAVGGRPRGPSLVRRVRGADQPVVGPWDEEHDLAGHADRQAGRRGDAVPWHDDMGAAAGQDPGRAARERVLWISSPDTGRVDNGPGSHLQVGARGEIARSKPLEGPVGGIRLDAPCLDPGECERLRLGGEGRAEDGQRQAGVVFHAVVVQQAAAQAPATKRRNDRQGLLHREPPVPTAVVPGAEDVVQRHARVVEGLAEEWDAVDRKEERLERDQVRRVPQEPAPFGERFTDEPDLKLLQVPQAAVDEPRRP
jgi:hypothetical protein